MKITVLQGKSVLRQSGLEHLFILRSKAMCDKKSHDHDIVVRFKDKLDKVYDHCFKQEKGEGKSLVDTIDCFCESVAVKLGETITECSPLLFNLDHIGWIVGQYRGTAISGERRTKDHFVSKNMGGREESIYLLETYCRLYGLGASLGEIFYRRTLSNVYEQNNREGQNPIWHALRVTLQDRNDMEFEKDNGKNASCELRYNTLCVPRQWLDELIPEPLFDRLLNKFESVLVEERLSKTPQDIINDSPQKIKNILEKCCFQTSFEKTLNSCTARLLASGPHPTWPKDVQTSQDFLSKESGNNEVLLHSVIKSIQLMGLYWRWSKKRQNSEGDLLVLCPEPSKGSMRDMPRLGFAIQYAANEDCALRSQVENIVSFLNRTLTPHLEVLAKRWMDLGHREENLLNKRIGVISPLVETLKVNVSEARNGSRADANILLRRVMDVILEISKLIPSFVHENHRYKVDILLGVPYHEQILGKRIADLSKETARFGDICHPDNEVNVLKQLIEASYSFLDAQDVAIFGQFSSQNEGTIRWTSLLKLDSKGNNIPSVHKYEEITRGHGNLFAISIGKDSKLKLFCGGKPLLEYWQDRWLEGAGTNTLATKLQEQMSHLKIFGNEVIGLDELHGFVKVIQSIAETPGTGAIFAITTSSNEIDRLDSVITPPEDIWSGRRLQDLLQDKNDVLFRLATMDGATAILIGKGNTAKDKWENATIYPRRLICEHFQLEAFKKKWADLDWLPLVSYGARRASALALALNSWLGRNESVEEKIRTPYLCVVISADGPIYIMCGSDKVKPINERIPKEMS
jgi:hypothetical protein